MITAQVIRIKEHTWTIQVTFSGRTIIDNRTFASKEAALDALKKYKLRKI